MTPEQALDLLRQLIPEANHIVKNESQSICWYKKKPKAGNKMWISIHPSGFLDRTSTIDWPSNDWKECIVSHEEPITDEDACKRIKVMVRDNEKSKWEGPFTLAAFIGKSGFKFLVFNEGNFVGSYIFAKRVTECP